VADHDEHADNCVHARRIGTVYAAPDGSVSVEHVACSQHPTYEGAIGLRVICHPETGPDEAPEHRECAVLLGLGEALALANRLQRAVDVVLGYGEEPESNDLALARILP
jgi:hypothetical protein